MHNKSNVGMVISVVFGIALVILAIVCLVRFFILCAGGG